MRIHRERLDTFDETLQYLEETSPRTVIVDVEPLIAPWNTNTTALNEGVKFFLNQVAKLPGITDVCFATNSRRCPASSSLLGTNRMSVSYVTFACKPFWIAHFADLPRPGIVIGDQIATDGLLAWRLGYTFAHYHPSIDIPIKSKLMGMLGQLFTPLAFEHQPQRPSHRRQKP